MTNADTMDLRAIVEWQGRIIDEMQTRICDLEDALSADDASHRRV